MKKNKLIFVLLLLVFISAVAYSSTFLYLKINNVEDSQEDFVIMTSCNPVYMATLNLADHIDGVRVENLSQPTTGCLHDYTLTTQDMKNLSHADLLVVNGGGMEGYLEDVIVAYPDLPIIDASQDMAFLHDETDEHEDDHDHDEIDEHEDDHDHEEAEDHAGHDHSSNSHVWLSARLYVQEVEAIAQGLMEQDPDHEREYISNKEAYVEALDSQLISYVQDLSAQMSGQNVVLLHEAYEYIAEDLGLNVVATMDLDEERQVSAGEVADIIATINDMNVDLVLAEEDYGSDMGQLIMDQTDAHVVYLDTLIHGSFKASDYIDIMLDNLGFIEEAGIDN